MDANRPLNHDLQWDPGAATGADSSASQHWGRYRLLVHLFGTCSPWLVLRSHLGCYVQGECKASGQLHWYLCDLLRSGRHLQQLVQKRYNRDLERQRLLIVLRELFSRNNCFVTLHPCPVTPEQEPICPILPRRGRLAEGLYHINAPTKKLIHRGQQNR